MATHSSILAWKTPWAEEPGGDLEGYSSWGHKELDTTEHIKWGNTIVVSWSCDEQPTSIYSTVSETGSPQDFNDKNKTTPSPFFPSFPPSASQLPPHQLLPPHSAPSTFIEHTSQRESKGRLPL